MDRLLTNWEIVKILPADADGECGVCDRIAKAQLAKADKDWLEWRKGDCPHATKIRDYPNFNHKDKGLCTECWKEREMDL